MSSLMLMNVHSIKKARSFYALSCITSPGGKHRGLAGSVAVLISESLLMLIQGYDSNHEKTIRPFLLRPVFLYFVHSPLGKRLCIT
jgi:hypothetical protein